MCKRHQAEATGRTDVPHGTRLRLGAPCDPHTCPPGHAPTRVQARGSIHAPPPHQARERPQPRGSPVASSRSRSSKHRVSQRDTRGLSGARARWQGGGRWGTGRAVLAERCRPFARLTRSSLSPPQSFLQSHFSPINIPFQTQVRREPRGWEVSPGLQEQTHTVGRPTSTGDAEPGERLGGGSAGFTRHRDRRTACLSFRTTCAKAP